MGLSNQELLQKATLSLSDFGGSGEAPLTIEQVEEFLRLAITPQVMLPDVKTVKSNSNKWQESTLDFASRILQPGTESTRLTPSGQVKPTTGIVEISTVLLRGEVPVSDEVMEDQVERAGFGDTIMSMVAEGSGRDIEQLFIQGDDDASVVTPPSGDETYLALSDGWLKIAYETGGNTYDASGDGADYQEIFKTLLSMIADKYKKDLPNWRFYVPKRLEEMYRDQLAARGTPLGDLMLEGGREVKYQTIPIRGVPLFPIASGTPDTSFILFAHRLNLYGGYRREVRMETFRDPREGATSFIVNTRVDAEIAVPGATAIAYTVNVEA